MRAEVTGSVMHLKQIILACLATALANGAMAQQLTLKSGYPETYVVQKGDTLWDIANEYKTEEYASTQAYIDEVLAMNNLNTDGVTVQRGMRRLPFPQSEYNTNNANVKAAVSMLGGADNSATDLWWAKKN
mgnify:CR=1 FL=1